MFPVIKKGLPMPLPLPRPVFDANASAGGLGNLPDWDLTDLYAAPDAPEFERDMGWLEKACADFAAAYEGKLATLDAALDQMLSARASRLWLAGPQLMARRFEQLRQGGAEPDTWLDDFGREMQQTQLAELEARLQPVLGLIETFSTEVKRLTQNMRKQSDGTQPAALVHPCLRKS